MARVLQLSWFKWAKRLPVRGIRRKSGFHSLQLTSRAGRWGFRRDASFDKGVLGWNGKSDFHTLWQGYGSRFARTPTRWLKAKTSPIVREHAIKWWYPGSKVPSPYSEGKLRYYAAQGT
jgi:hypothetical protein